MKSKSSSFLALLLLFILSTTSYSQVGIGTTNPHVSSILDIQSENTGILIPRVSLTRSTTKAPITNPVESLLVYNTNTTGDVSPGFYYWKGTAWNSLGSTGGSAGTGGWGLRGNVVGDDDFLGTLQNYKPLKFKVDGAPFGQFHPGGGITLGKGASANNDNAISIGTNSNAGTSNSIAIGSAATASASNLAVAIGNNAKASNHQSVALGSDALASSHSSLALGVNSSASGQGSTALGRESSVSGQYSTAIGYGATVSQANTIRLGNDNAKVGIGTSTPNVSSILEINATNKGLLIPRVALTGTTDQATISQPAISLLVYNTSTTGNITPGFYYWSGSAWKALASSSDGGGFGGNKSYGERYYSADETVSLNQYSIRAAPKGTANPITTTDITTNGNGLTPTTAGVYRVTLTVTYSKQVANPNVNSVEFFITKNTNQIANTSIRGDLNDDLKRRTLTMVKILNLEAWQTYHFAMGKTNPEPSSTIILHKDLTNMTIERID